MVNNRKINVINRIIINCIASLFLLLGFGCQENDHMLFSDVARIEMHLGKDTLRTSFVTFGEEIDRDTVYVPVSTMGYLSDKPRRVKLIQLEETRIEYKKDEKGEIVDSVFIKVPFQAIPGVHYVPLDDCEADVAPMKNNARIGIILLRDKSLKTQEYRLCLKVDANEYFQLGMPDELTAAVIFSDKLIQPSTVYWNRVKNYFGAYSERKHRFINSTFNIDMNDAWLKEITIVIANLQFYQTTLQDRLKEYNDDPENITNGLSPMREIESDPTSPLIEF